MEILKFHGEYDKKNFYSLMGKFFAEREFKKEMPYLVNRENEVWILALKNGEVQGFASYLELKNKIDLGYIYGIDSNIQNNLIDILNLETKKFNKPISVAIFNDKNLDKWIELNFNILKRTINYTFLEKGDR